MIVASSYSMHEFPRLLSLSFRDVGERSKILPDGWIGHIDGILVVI